MRSSGAARRPARRLALDILYQADVTQTDPVVALEERRGLGEEIPAFTEELVRGVAARRGELDTLIGEHAQEWTVARMAVVDRNVLRLAVHELLVGETPVAVAIDEAVIAAKELSTEDSGRFVNGILGKIARESAGRAPGSARGQVTVAPDFDAPLP